MKSEYDFSKSKRGAIAKASGKTRITIFLDDDVIQAFRDRAESSGCGYQTAINNALRESIATNADDFVAARFHAITENLAKLQNAIGKLDVHVTALRGSELAQHKQAIFYGEERTYDDLIEDAARLGLTSVSIRENTMRPNNPKSRNPKSGEALKGGEKHTTKKVLKGSPVTSR